MLRAGDASGMSVPWGSWLIESWEELPRGSVDSPLPERVWFDVKRRYEEEPGKRDRRTQMAKDIAAFANASGGVIIVGAVEAKDGPQFYKHTEREEWIADVTVKGRAKDAKDTIDVRLGIVLVGMSEHP